MTVMKNSLAKEKPTTAAKEIFITLECGPMPNLMVVLPNTGGALCSTA